jgi:hypothetical protein
MGNELTDMTVPILYETKNIYNAYMSPSTVHCRNTNLQKYYRRYLMQKAISVFKWDLPKEWDKDYFLYTLYGYGYTAIINTEEFGVIPQWGALGGYNVFYRPTYIMITNPLIKGMKKPTIGVDCTIIKLQPDYGGITDLVNYYADLLALCSESISINLINSHVATVFPAASKSIAESYKKMFDKLSSGEPAVVVDKNLFNDTGEPTWTPFQANIKNEYIVDQVLADMRKIEAMFDTDVGIPNANTDKKERLVTDEVNANNVETATRCELWLEQIKEAIEETNTMFGTSISVDWRVDPKTDIVDNWQSEGRENNAR